MKRLFATLICALMLVTMFIPVSAEEGGEDFVAEIGDISLPYGSPTIDGAINSGEGWSAAQPYDKTNVDGGWGGEPVTIAGNLYRAYDETNFYIAAEILIEEVALCEGEDWIDGSEYGNLPGWDGDTFIITLDPLCELINNGFGSETPAWYCFGIFDGGVVKSYRTHVNDKEIGDIAPAAGGLIDGGWRFEAAIPWETICADLDACSYGDISLTPEDILEDGSPINASFIYYDRRFDHEAEERITYSRYVSIATITADGMPGTLVTPWLINAQGITFLVEGKAEDTTSAAPDDTTTKAPDDTTTTAAESGEVVTNASGEAVTDASGNKVTKKPASTTKPASTGSSTGASSAQTYDIGLAIAIGAFATSGIVFVATKKKK